MALIKSPSEVGSCYRSKTLLAGRIPDLQFKRGIGDIDGFRAKLYAYGGVEVVLESLADELRHDTRLAYARIPDDNVFE